MATPSPDVVLAIRQGTLRLARLLRSERSPDALSPNKTSVLSNLIRCGPMSAGALANADRQSPQTLTRVFAELERAGLTTRVPDPQDHRRSLLEITAKGREALDQDMAERDAWLARVLDTLTETEQQLLCLAGHLMSRLADPREQRRAASDE